ncbi:MAG TPA: glycosyltransferase [Vicinamibacteria bacterium]|nr:glycosyltransferase [Vicinamibacteria bacterium]
MRILFAHQGYPPEASGGSELYLEGLARALATRHDVAVLHRSADPAREDHDVVEASRDGVRLFAVNNLHRRHHGFEAYRDPDLAVAAERVIESFAPEVVHVHHLNGLSTGLVFEARRRGVPVVVTLHDFWPACPLGQLVNLRLEVCPGPTPRRCLSCVGAQVAWRPSRIAARLETMCEALRAADAVLAPSRFLADRLAALGFPGIEHLPNGLPPLHVDRRARAAGPVRFGFVGACIPSKGVHVLAEAFARLEHPRAALGIHGAFASYHGDEGYERRVRERLRGVPAAELCGPFPRARLAQVLADLDVLVVPSVWEENAPLVVEEAFQARRPVVAADHGGLRERIRHGVDGLLFRPGDVDGLTRAMRRLLDEPGLLDGLGRAPLAPVAVEAHAEALLERYARARERYRTRAGRVGVVVVNHGRPEDTAAAVGSALDPTLDPVVVVVENGPSPEPALPAGVELLRLAENRGFAAGANAGLRRLRERGCDRALLLNNDARLEPGALRRLAEAVEDEGLAAAGPVVLRADGRVESRGLRIDTRWGRARLVGHGERDTPSEGRVAAEALSGAAVMLRLNALDAVGALDEDYFHAFEDAEWCLRARRAGLSLAVVLGARVRHASAATLGASADRLYYAARNHLRAAERLRPLHGVARRAREAAILALNLAHALRQSEVPRLLGARAVLAGFDDFRRGRFGPRPA